MVEPLRIVLEFARAQDAGDPHAFRFAPQAYLVRGRRGDFESATVEWTRELLADLEAVRLPGRDPAALARIGEVLRRILEPAGWREHEVDLVEAVAEGRPVHVTLRSAAAELYALPWELLTLKSTGQSLGAIPLVLLRYEWPATTSARPSGRGAPGRVLVAWSAAGGPVPAEGHVAAARAAAEAAGRPFDGARDVLGRASYGRLADLLAAAASVGPPIEVLHLLCHGAAQGSTFGLALDGEGDEGDDAAPVVVDPARLQQLLAPHAGMVRLVVLAACDGGNAGSPGNRLGSVAQMLHRVGIAAVIASRYPFSSAGSTRMSEALHRGLLSGHSLEVAFVGARAALARDPTTLDWASAQLYARADDGDATFPLTLEAAPIAAAAPTVTPEPEVPALAATGAPAAAGGGRRWGLVAGAAAVVGALALALVLSRSGGDEVPKTPAAATGADTGAPEKMTKETGPKGPVPEAISAGASSTAGAAAASAGAATTSAAAASAATTVEATTTGEAPEAPTTTPTKVTKTTKKTATTPATTPTQDPSQACERGLRDYLQTRVGAPPGGGVFKVRVKVDGDGGATVARCDGCGDDEAAARKALKERVDPATAKDKGKGKVPCTASFDWQ